MKWRNQVKHGLQIMVLIGSVSALLGLAVYAYGGFFVRLLADDYCESVWLISTGNVFTAAGMAYRAWLNSYSTLFIVQIVDWFGVWGLKLMVTVMLVLWMIVNFWLLDEIQRSWKLTWSWSIKLWLAVLPIFLSLYQTPVLYQILYWRTGMIPYSLPLVFFTGIAAMMLGYARQPYILTRSVWIGLMISVLVIFATGLGETTGGLLVGLAFLALVITWLTRSIHRRMDVVILILLVLAWSVICLLLMAAAPGTTSRLDRIMDNPPLYNPINLGVQVLIYTAQFLWDMLKVTPLTVLIDFLIPFSIQFIQSDTESDIHYSSQQLMVCIATLLIIMFIAIGFSFAPSAFVRTYPTARARFPAHVIMNLCLMLEGGMLGIWVGQLRFVHNTTFIKWLALVVLGVSSVYSPYASAKLQTLLSEDQKFALAWDDRDAYIRKAAADGATSVVIKQFNPIGGVGEIKDDPTNWINQCAAQYYGLESIAAP